MGILSAIFNPWHNEDDEGSGSSNSTFDERNYTSVRIPTHTKSGRLKPIVWEVPNDQVQKTLRQNPGSEVVDR